MFKLFSRFLGSCGQEDCIKGLSQYYLKDPNVRSPRRVTIDYFDALSPKELGPGQYKLPEGREIPAICFLRMKIGIGTKSIIKAGLPTCHFAWTARQTLHPIPSKPGQGTLVMSSLDILDEELENVQEVLFDNLKRYPNCDHAARHGKHEMKQVLMVLLLSFLSFCASRYVHSEWSPQ